MKNVTIALLLFNPRSKETMRVEIPVTVSASVRGHVADTLASEIAKRDNPGWVVQSVIGDTAIFA